MSTLFDSLRTDRPGDGSQGIGGRHPLPSLAPTSAGTVSDMAAA